MMANISSRDFYRHMAAQAVKGIPDKPKKRKPRLRIGSATFDTFPRSMSFWVPTTTVSEMNCRDHPLAVSRRKQSQKEAVAAIMGRWESVLRAMGPRWLVTLCRVGAKELDTDNLHSSLKAVRDAVATLLGVDDKDGEAVEWSVEQDVELYKKIGSVVWVRVYRA